MEQDKEHDDHLKEKYSQKQIEKIDEVLSEVIELIIDDYFKKKVKE